MARENASESQLSSCWTRRKRLKLRKIRIQKQQQQKSQGKLLILVAISSLLNLTTQTWTFESGIASSTIISMSGDSVESDSSATLGFSSSDNVFDYDVWPNSLEDGLKIINNNNINNSELNSSNNEGENLEPEFQDETSGRQPRVASDKENCKVRLSLLSQASRTLATLAFICIWLFGTIGNGLTLYVLFKKRRRLTITDIFIGNLAISDLNLCTFGITVIPISIVNYGYWNFGILACKSFSFAVSMSVHSSTLTMIAIARHRFELIVNHHKVSISRRRAYLECAILWALSAFIATPYALNVEIVPKFSACQKTSVGSPPQGYCAEDWSSPGFSRLTYSIITLMTQFFLPLMTASYFYGCIFKRIQQNERTRPHRRFQQELIQNHGHQGQQDRRCMAAEREEEQIFQSVNLEIRDDHQDVMIPLENIKSLLGAKEGALIDSDHKLGGECLATPTNDKLPLNLEEGRDNQYQDRSNCSKRISNNNIAVSFNRASIDAGSSRNQQAPMLFGTPKSLFPHIKAQKSATKNNNQRSNNNNSANNNKNKQNTNQSHNHRRNRHKLIRFPLKRARSDLATTRPSLLQQQRLDHVGPECHGQLAASASHLAQQQSHLLLLLSSAKQQPDDKNGVQHQNNKRLIQHDKGAATGSVSRPPATASTTELCVFGKRLQLIGSGRGKKKKFNLEASKWPKSLACSASAQAALGHLDCVVASEAASADFEGQRNKRTRQTNLKLLAILGLFIISWLPMNLYNLFADIYNPIHESEMEIMYIVCQLSASVSVCLNPVLYAWKSENWRRELNNIGLYPKRWTNAKSNPPSFYKFNDFNNNNKINNVNHTNNNNNNNELSVGSTNNLQSNAHPNRVLHPHSGANERRDVG